MSVRGTAVSLNCFEMDVMNGKELSVALREMARGPRDPLCDEWYGEWADDSDIDVLLDKYVRGFDFAVKNDYPPLAFVREHFSRDDLHRHHIYLDESVDLVAENGTYVFLGDCRVRLRAELFKAVTVYVRHESVIEVVGDDTSRLFVSLYDRCRLVGCSGDVRVYDRRKKEV